MYHSLSDFYKSWEFETGATSRILKNLTDESLKQEVTPNQWSLGVLRGIRSLLLK